MPANHAVLPLPRTLQGAPRLLAVAILFALPVISGCDRGETPVHLSQFDAFDTRVDLQLLSASPQLAAELTERIAADFALIDYAFGLDRPGPMQRVNELLATSEPFAAPPSLLPLLRQTQALAERSGNLFNPALGMLTRLWRFDPETGNCEGPPPMQTIAGILESDPRLSEISIEGIQLLSDDPAVKLDFSGVSHAYAMDLAMASLHAQGIRSAMIRVGNDLRVSGDRAGQPWRIAVPRGSGGGVLGMLDLSGDASVITLGRFQQPCMYQGRRYARVLDPRTGYPSNGTQLVTVLHRGDAVTAAAAAVALFVAGPEQWNLVAQRMGITAALLIDDAGTVHLSPTMQRHLTIIDRNARASVSPSWTEAASN